jgi:hypothetical protein
MRTKVAKLIAGIIAAVLLGAIGSGLWETFLRPLVHMGVDLIVALFGSISQAFKDRLYREAAQGFHEQHSLSLLLFIYGVLTGAITGSMMTVPLLAWLSKKREPHREVNQAGEATTLARMKFAAVLTGLFTFLAARASYINRVSTWSLTSIERVSASIDQSEYHRLRAMFYRVGSAKEYYDFYHALKKKAEEKAINLSEFEPL